MSDELTRRQFFRLGPVDILRGLVDGQGRAGAGRKESPIRPPSAQAEDAFLRTCERCGKCAEACIHEAIRRFGPAGGRNEGTPYLLPAKKPCYWCETMDCVHACPSGALRFGEDGKAAPIGTAVIDADLCLVSGGTLCDLCVSFCPSAIRAISMAARRPVVDEGRCTGCGLCAKFCPAEESAIRIVASAGRSGS